MYMNVKNEATTKTRTASRSRFLLSEISALASVVAVGWFLIGYYARYEFLETGYQDWAYHAFRIKDIARYGIASWDHVWANGINHWRAFQYAPHVVTLWISQLTGLSITSAMMWVSVIVFIGLRVFMYGAFRLIGIGPLFSVFAVMVSYASSQQWVAIGDFSIYVAFIVLPLYVLLWIRTLQDNGYIYLLAAVTGASWSLHPVVGYSLTAMFALLVLADNLKKDGRTLLRAISVLAVSSLPFVLPYFSSGYVVNNPHSGTGQFLQQLLVSEYMGLSFIFFALLGFGWVTVLLKSQESPRWAKLLLLYCTLYLGFIHFGLAGYYPSFVNKLQFSRAIPLIAILASFSFAAFLQTAFSQVRSRMFYTIILTLIVVSITQSVEIASRYSGQPTTLPIDPVATYFSDKDVPEGSIYVRDVPSASYMSKPGLRFVTSYNRFPNPYSVRFNTLMKTDIAFTGVTMHQIRMIDDYATVLGVEYIFLPKISPLVDGLTVRQGAAEPSFEKVGEVMASSDVYVVLRNRRPVANAYAYEKDIPSNSPHFQDLPKPTLQASSYKAWDEEVARTANLIRNGALKPLKLSFVWPNELIVDGGGLSSLRNPDVLVMQSYDTGWSVSGTRPVGIDPTSLRFMRLSLPEGMRSGEIRLRNDWPWWHWPVQGLGVVMILLSGAALWKSSVRVKDEPVAFFK